MDIINLIKDRDEKGLSMLYDNYAPALLGIINGIVQHRETAEEILQESFLKVWEGIEGYNNKRGTLFTWMATIARRKAIDKVRLKSYGSSEALDATLHGGSTTPVVETNIDSQRLLSKLSSDHSTVLSMVYLRGMSQQQTADALDIPLGTVKTRVRLALKTLREELDGEKKLFFGTLLLIILTMLILWT